MCCPCRDLGCCGATGVVVVIEGVVYACGVTHPVVDPTGYGVQQGQARAQQTHGHGGQAGGHAAVVVHGDVEPPGAGHQPAAGKAPATPKSLLRIGAGVEQVGKAGEAEELQQARCLPLKCAVKRPRHGQCLCHAKCQQQHGDASDPGTAHALWCWIRSWGLALWLVHGARGGRGKP